MAKMYPPLDKIDLLEEPVMPGERALLTALSEYLDDSYEIFFQARIGGMHPDIIILRRGVGMHIIEVKDWDLRNYTVQNKSWVVKGERLPGPIAQVTGYKEELYNYFMPEALKKITFNKDARAMISCSVYFHNHSQKSIDNFIVRNTLKVKHTECTLWGNDILSSKAEFTKLVQAAKIHLFTCNWSKFFSDKIYNEVRRLCQPTNVTIDSMDASDIVLDKGQQDKLDRFSQRIGSGCKMKIRGAAGTGKTLLLANFALEALKRTEKRVLVLTYNITLRWKIVDTIMSLNKDGLDVSKIEVYHYHRWIYNYCLNNQTDEDDFEASVISNGAERYTTILVDETQDFKKEWIENIHCVLAPKGNLVFFADEHQNIYKQAKFEKDKTIFTGVGGRWNLLDGNHRYDDKLTNISNLFQEECLTSYDYQPIPRSMNLFSDASCAYIYPTEDFSCDFIYAEYEKYANEYKIQDNDVAFLSSRREYIRNLDYFLRKEKNKKTITTIVNKETYDETVKMFGAAAEDELYDMRRCKKFHFHNISGKLKLSTIHSFKGWEANTVFLLVTPDDTDETFAQLVDAACANKKLKLSPEESSKNAGLIYTGLTRCRSHLIIINLGNKDFDRWLKHHEAELLRESA